MKKFVAASSVFLLFLFSGGLWVGLAQFIPAGLPRTIVSIAFAVLFAGVFVWLLIQRVQAILRGTPHLVRHMLVAAAELALLLLAFASVYQTFGLIDNTQEGAPVVHSFTSSLYYSVVTFTTLGYGDFYPVGPGRVLACIESLTGYLILGVLASTASSVLSPGSKAGFKREDND